MRLRRAIRHLGRLRHISAVLCKYGLEETLSSLGRHRVFRLGRRRDPAASGNEHTRAQRVRMALEEMGPTFVKFGQLLSTRPDLVAPEYVEELRRLQENVAPVPLAAIQAEIAAELEGSLEDHFAQFDTAPVAAGSIAQVHRAVTVEGDEVAVKVRRPGAVRTVQIECEILEDLAGLVKKVFSLEENIDPVRLVGELTAAIGKETDLANELRNLERFRRNFADDPTVRLPKAFPKHCSGGILTMEFIRGQRLYNREDVLAAGLDPDLIAERGARFVLRQVFDFGLFHTDPHPGNLMAADGNVVVVLDFGQVARLNSANRTLLGELVLAIVENDPGRLVHALDEQDMLGGDTSVAEVTAEVEEVLDLYRSLPIGEVPFGRIMAQTFDSMRRNHVRPPAEFTLMLKSMATIESLARGLRSDFGLLEHLRPFARRLTLQQADPRRLVRLARQSLKDTIELARRLPADLRAIAAKARRGEIQVHVRHEHLENLVRTLDKSSDRVSFAMIIAGLLVASSMLVSQQGHVLGFISMQTLGVIGYMVAAVLGLWVLWSIVRSRKD